MHIDRTINKSGSAFFAVLLSGLALAGCTRQPPSPSGAPEVSIVTLQPQRITLTTQLPGRTQAFRIAEIRPQISGLILKRLFTEGSDVKAGQVLYEIDPAPFQAALDNARAVLRRAEANLSSIGSRAERYKELLAEKAVSQQDYDDAADALKQTRADIESWKAQVETARINLGYTKVTAPISGRIGKSSVTDGAIVTAYQPTQLASIQQMDPIYVDVPQSTTELFRLRRRLEEGSLRHEAKDQNKARLILEDGTPYPAEGTLQFSDISVDPSTGSVILRTVFPNPKGMLLPGMFVRVVVKEGIEEQAILVPQQGVSRNPKGEPFALIVGAEDKVVQRMLTFDREIGDKWLVTAGLASGDRVIVEGLQMLPPGTVVKTTPFKEDAAKPANRPAPSPKPSN